MKAKISNKVGGVKVHKRPASAVLVEPNELWPGYNVEVIGEYQGKQHLWVKIYYLYNGTPYTGWVISEAIEYDPFGTPPAPFPPPDVEIPVPETKFFRNPTEAIVTVVVSAGAVLWVTWQFIGNFICSLSNIC